MIESSIDMLDDETLDEIESEIEIEGSEESFEGIREDIWIILPFCNKLSTRELDNLRHME